MVHALYAYFAGFALCAALIVAIGAQNLFVLRQGLLREHVGPIVLFCITADVALITLGVGGVAAFLTAIPQLTTSLTLGGAGFLAWYGIAAFRRMASVEAMSVTAGRGQPLASAMAAVAGFTFLNPHVYLDTVLLMGAAGAANPPSLRPLFIAGAGTASALWFLALGYGARLLGPLFTRPAAWRVLDGVVGSTMVLMAASLALSLIR